MRILVTGSRAWENEGLVHLALGQLAFAGSHANSEVVIVHGDCPTGADAMAKAWAIQNNITQEAHPANWAKYGRSAGPIRNKKMVKLGADVCVAFPLGQSRGTRHCMAKALEANIRVLNYGDPETPHDT
jgi:hypothetical protein